MGKVAQRRQDASGTDVDDNMNQATKGRGEISTVRRRSFSVLLLAAAAASIPAWNSLYSKSDSQSEPNPASASASASTSTSTSAHQSGECPTLAERQVLATRTHDLLHSPAPDEEYYANLLAEIHAGCGELCTNDEGRRRVPLEGVPEADLPVAGYFDYRVVASGVSCCTLFAHPLLDAPAVRWPPPRDIPEVMRDEFLGFRGDDGVALANHHYEERFSGGKAATPVWTVESIERMKQQSLEGKLIGNYGGKGTAKLRAYAAKYCGGKHVAVVGSKSPWVEAILLGVGARHVTTIEYGAIESRHPNVTALTNAEFNERFLNGTLEPFDAFVSYSSMEHAGLGRYGDSLNPWGDVIMAAKMHCALRTGGVAIVGVPTLPDGGEGLVFNAHRQYGKARWPLLLTNYRPLPRLQVEGEYYHQEIVAAEAV